MVFCILRYESSEKFINELIHFFINMMELNQNAAFRIEQDLLNCGLTQDSINSIRDTTVITRNGSQHVVPGSQAHLSEAQSHAPSTAIMSEDSSLPQSNLVHRLHEQQKMFSRYKQHSENRIATLERNLNSTMENIKQLHSAVATMKSNQQAQQQRVVNSSPSVETPSQQETPQPTKQQAPVKAPVDRNGIAPVDVKVENIFYCGER